MYVKLSESASKGKKLCNRLCCFSLSHSGQCFCTEWSILDRLLLKVHAINILGNTFINCYSEHMCPGLILCVVLQNAVIQKQSLLVNSSALHNLYIYIFRYILYLTFIIHIRNMRYNLSYLSYLRHVNLRELNSDCSLYEYKKILKSI